MDAGAGLAMSAVPERETKPFADRRKFHLSGMAVVNHLKEILLSCDPLPDLAVLLLVEPGRRFLSVEPERPSRSGAIRPWAHRHVGPSRVAPARVGPSRGTAALR